MLAKTKSLSNACVTVCLFNLFTFYLQLLSGNHIFKSLRRNRFIFYYKVRERKGENLLLNFLKKRKGAYYQIPRGILYFSLILLITF